MSIFNVNILFSVLQTQDPQQLMNYVIIMCLHILNLLQLFYMKYQAAAETVQRCAISMPVLICQKYQKKHVQNTKQITENLSF